MVEGVVPLPTTLSGGTMSQCLADIACASWADAGRIQKGLESSRNQAPDGGTGNERGVTVIDDCAPIYRRGNDAQRARRRYPPGGSGHFRATLDLSLAQGSSSRAIAAPRRRTAILGPLFHKEVRDPLRLTR